ncbi:MAG TPA: tRNA 2-thiouridine(34) synthase MnmA [Planctomycetota bacterium]|nr:tRNA 2-thiouridine(34) synthase MnmA [Planctomycetota bacterium]
MRIAVAMSGGVDSSVSAALLKEAGHEVLGLFMRLASEPAGARRVAEHLGIAFEAVDFTGQREALIAYFCSEYDAGRTPNPCVVCNRRNKFGRLLDHARALGAERLATGHYVRLAEREGRRVLRRGLDPTKDQSYVLSRLTQDQLGQALFPLGELRKEDVRRMARERGLPVHEGGESQDICFVPGGDYVALLRERIPDRIRPGPILDTSGRVLGEHPGCQCFTIGQRQGLRVALGSPRYVVRIDRQANAVVIGTREELERTTMLVSDVNWMAFAEPPARIEAAVQVRYNHRPVPAAIEPLPDGSARVTFARPETAITPGQAAVFYDGEIVLGGGWIEE